MQMTAFEFGVLLSKQAGIGGRIGRGIGWMASQAGRGAGRMSNVAGRTVGKARAGVQQALGGAQQAVKRTGEDFMKGYRQHMPAPKALPMPAPAQAPKPMGVQGTLPFAPPTPAAAPGTQMSLFEAPKPPMPVAEPAAAAATAGQPNMLERAYNNPGLAGAASGAAIGGATGAYRGFEEHPEDPIAHGAARGMMYGLGCGALGALGGRALFGKK